MFKAWVRPVITPTAVIHYIRDFERHAFPWLLRCAAGVLINWSFYTQHINICLMFKWFLGCRNLCKIVYNIRRSSWSRHFSHVEGQWNGQEVTCEGGLMVRLGWLLVRQFEILVFRILKFLAFEFIFFWTEIVFFSSNCYIA